MEVHVVMYRWNTEEYTSCDIVGVYSDFEVACSVLHNHMSHVKNHIQASYRREFDANFDMNEKTYVSFGFYNGGFGLNHCWVATVETVNMEAIPVWN